MSLRVAIAIALVALVGCSPIEWRHEGPATTLALAPEIRAPAEPAVPWSSSARASLRRALDGLHGTYLAGAGLCVVDGSGSVLYDRNAHRAYAPASTIKLLVAATALGTLGPDARLATRLESLEQPDESGRIAGDLWLHGSGDPVFEADELQGGVGVLARRGVRRIDGDLIVDASAFSGPEQNPAWAADDFENGYAAGTSALSLHWDVIEFRIVPTQVGAPARVRAFPNDPEIVIRGVPLTGYTTDLHIDRIAPGRNEFVLGGTIYNGAELTFYRPAAGIPQWVGRIAAAMLRERSIELNGAVRVGTDPLAAQTLWEHRSPPLATIVRRMLHESDNHIAEQLLRIVGSDGGGSMEAGAMAERAYLTALGVPVDGLRVVDGSGLAETDRLAPVTLARLLAAAPALFDLLPRAGIEGTVRHHALGAALGLVRAKSGHIDGVNALAGYVRTRAHGRLAFAVMVNAPGADDATSIESAIDNALDAIAQL